MTSRPTLLFITNPISGNLHYNDLHNLIIESMRLYDADYDIVVSEYAGHAKHLAADAVADGFDIVVACGGDGTINEIGTQLIGTQTSLGIIPYGSGNGLAHHVGIPINTRQALEYLKKGHPIAIDTVNINNTPFISIAGIGFDAKVAQDYSNDKGRGFHTYFKYMLQNYFTLPEQEFKITLGNDSFNIEAFFISLANSNEQGYGIPISPKASLRDGLVDVCIVRKPNAVELPIIGSYMLAGNIDKAPKVNIIQTSHIIIERSHNEVVNIDGDPVMMDKKLEIKVAPLSLNIIANEKQA